MKKAFFIAFLSLLCCVSSVFSQGHLTFKGIPIDGSLASFTTKMKAKGFSSVEVQADGAMYKGTFAGMSDSYITAFASNGIVTTVIVHFPTMTAWSILESKYFELKSMLSQKYGEPTRYSEYFQSPYDNESSDSDKMIGTQFDHCKYCSIFEVALGQIELHITHNDRDCYVMLKYFDKVNYSKKESSAYDDL